MKSKHLEELRLILNKLQLESNNRLSDRQKQLIIEAQEVLICADKQTREKTFDWHTFANLSIQGIKLVVELMKSDGG